MDPLTIIGVVSQVLQLIPAAVDLEQNVQNLINRTLKITKDPQQATRTDVDAVLEAIDQLTVQLNTDPPR